MIKGFWSLWEGLWESLKRVSPELGELGGRQRQTAQPLEAFTGLSLSVLFSAVQSLPLVSNTHILPKILTYITTILRPST